MHTHKQTQTLTTDTSEETPCVNYSHQMMIVCVCEYKEKRLEREDNTAAKCAAAAEAQIHAHTQHRLISSLFTLNDTNINICNQKERTPLHYAVLKRKKERGKESSKLQLFLSYNRIYVCE